MKPEDMQKLQGDMARLNAALSKSATLDMRAFHAQMEQSMKAHNDSIKSMHKSMEDMRKSIDASFGRARDAYRKTPEYKRMNDEMTFRAQWVIIPGCAVTLAAVTVALIRALM